MWANPFEDETIRFSVLVNSESQYSLWPRFATAPQGWDAVFSGSRQESLDYIAQNWHDMRPLSVSGTTARGDETTSTRPSRSIE